MLCEMKYSMFQPPITPPKQRVNAYKRFFRYFVFSLLTRVFLPTPPRCHITGAGIVHHSIVAVPRYIHWFFSFILCFPLHFADCFSLSCMNISECSPMQKTYSLSNFNLIFNRFWILLVVILTRRFYLQSITGKQHAGNLEFKTVDSFDFGSNGFPGNSQKTLPLVPKGKRGNDISHTIKYECHVTFYFLMSSAYILNISMALKVKKRILVPFFYLTRASQALQIIPSNQLVVPRLEKKFARTFVLKTIYNWLYSLKICLIGWRTIAHPLSAFSSHVTNGLYIKQSYNCILLTH